MINRQLEKTVLILLLLLPLQGFALPDEFTASYSLESYGLTVARATYVLEHQSKGLKFSQHSETVGFASLFKNETLDETSLLSLHDNQLLLDEYSYIQKNSDKNRDVSFKISWVTNNRNKLTGNVNGTIGGEKFNLNIDKPVWDTLSFQIPVMTNTTEQPSNWKASMLVKGQLKNYEFITHGTETISISGNTIKTIKVERKTEDKDPVFFWLAPAFHNIPVKIEKWKNNKAYITMQLESASFPEKKNLDFKSKERIESL